jgi:signal peptidase II
MPEATQGQTAARVRATAPWFALAGAVVLVDFATKALALAYLGPRVRIEVTGFFNLVLVTNKGAAFSFLSSASGWQTPFFAAIALVAAVVIAVLLFRPGGSGMFRAALALVLGGALGNLIDRLRWGHVIDFLDFHAYGWHWPAFNAADSAITVGAVLLIVESFLGGRRGAR